MSAASGGPWSLSALMSSSFRKPVVNLTTSAPAASKPTSGGSPSAPCRWSRALGGKGGGGHEGCNCSLERHMQMRCVCASCSPHAESVCVCVVQNMLTCWSGSNLPAAMAVPIDPDICQLACQATNSIGVPCGGPPYGTNGSLIASSVYALKPGECVLLLEQQWYRSVAVLDVGCALRGRDTHKLNWSWRCAVGRGGRRDPTLPLF